VNRITLWICIFFAYLLLNIAIPHCNLIFESVGDYFSFCGATRVLEIIIGFPSSIIFNYWMPESILVLFVIIIANSILDTLALTEIILFFHARRPKAISRQL